MQALRSTASGWHRVRPPFPEEAVTAIRRFLEDIPEEEEQSLPEPPIVEVGEPKHLLGDPVHFNRDGHIVLIEPSINSLRVSWRFCGEDLAVARAARVGRDLCRFSCGPQQSLVRKQPLTGFFVTWLVTRSQLRHMRPSRIAEILKTMVSWLLEAPLDTVQSSGAADAARVAAINLRSCIESRGAGR